MRCSDDRSLPLVEKNLRLDGFSGRKLPSSRHGLDRRLFFCDAFNSYYEESDRGQTITAKKPDMIDEFTPKNTGIHQR